MKTRFKHARFQLYLWDSVRNHRAALSIVPLVDRVFTFDIEDSKNYNSWHLLPNYYVEKHDENRRQRDDNKPVRWNLTFIGTCHSDRLKIMVKVSQNLPPDIAFYRFVYFQSPLLYYFRKILDPAFRKFRPDELSLKPKLGAESDSVVQSTAAILDIHHPRQSGLSHRAVDALASGFKLVTTNEHIKSTPYYDEQRVYIIDRNAPNIDPEFLRLRDTRPLTGESAASNKTAASISPAQEAIRSLELKRWLETIFG